MENYYFVPTAPIDWNNNFFYVYKKEQLTDKQLNSKKMLNEYPIIHITKLKDFMLKHKNFSFDFDYFESEIPEIEVLNFLHSIA